MIDTHCHLDAQEFDLDREKLITTAKKCGVDRIIIPAVHPNFFSKIFTIAEKYPYCSVALGIHPLSIRQVSQQDIVTQIRSTIQNSPISVIAIGEIGLDFFVTRDNFTEQIDFFTTQLKLAKEFNLPVILHVRGAIDTILKCLRIYKVTGGIAHAFNGSLQQAEQFIQLGFKLGFGGACTYSRATKLQALARTLPIESIVLETDAPDIPPSWLTTDRRNTPQELPKIAEFIANVRSISKESLIRQTNINVFGLFPSLEKILS